MEREVPIASGRLTNVATGPSRTSRTGKTAPRQGGRGTPARRGRGPGSNVPEMADMPDPITLIRELNHRVKNNFQIIVSLMNLRKRMMPPDRREDIRFIEEHVQSMSVAYRLVYATGSITDVSLPELITDVLSGLRQIANLPEELLRFEVHAVNARIGLDHAIALALYLAVLVPPYLNEAMATAAVVTITLGVAANVATLTVGAAFGAPIALDLLRGRLMQAYAAQLRGELRSATATAAELITFTLEPPAPLSAI
jgi:Histidine kinase